MILKFKNHRIRIHFWKFLRRISEKDHEEKNLLKNSLNNYSYHRLCPPPNRAQQGKLDHHNWISLKFENLGNNNFKPTWYPNDLKSHVCNIKCNKYDQLESHFSSKKHKISAWNCTPKYCAPCVIYWGFKNPQLWEAHISSKKHNNKVGDKISSVHSFRN